MQIVTVTLPPNGGTQLDKTSGRFLNIMACNLPLLAAFDGGPGQVVTFNQTYEKTGFRYFTLVNNNAVAVTVSYTAGNHAANFQPVDNTVANAKHRPFYNLGIGDNTAAAGGAPACSASGYLQITAGMLLLVPGTNNGNTRQAISFDVAAASAAALQVKDLNGNTGHIITAGQPRLIVTDSALKISGLGGVASVAIAETYESGN